MKNTTEYTSEEVLTALVKYHKGRVPFDDKGFEVISVGFGVGGAWTVVTKERVKALPVQGKWVWQTVLMNLLRWMVRRWA